MLVCVTVCIYDNTLTVLPVLISEYEFLMYMVNIDLAHLSGNLVFLLSSWSALHDQADFLQMLYSKWSLSLCFHGFHVSYPNSSTLVYCKLETIMLRQL